MVQTIYDIVKAHGGELKVEPLSAGEAVQGSEGRSLLFCYRLKLSNEKKHIIDSFPGTHFCCRSSSKQAKN